MAASSDEEGVACGLRLFVFSGRLGFVRWRGNSRFLHCASPSLREEEAPVGMTRFIGRNDNGFNDGLLQNIILKNDNSLNVGSDGERISWKRTMGRRGKKIFENYKRPRGYQPRLDEHIVPANYEED